MHVLDMALVLLEVLSENFKIYLKNNTVVNQIGKSGLGGIRTHGLSKLYRLCKIAVIKGEIRAQISNG
jgi:hypothetical protein